MNARDEARVRWRHEDCDPSACVATMELGCEAVVLLATLDAERARRQGDPGLLREARAIVDTVDALGPFRDETGDELDIEDLRAALAALPPEPEPLDVERLRWAIEALDDIAETDRIWRAMQPERLAAAIAEQYRAARLSEPAQRETPK